MIRRPLVLALALAVLPTIASAEDLLQTYELARASDPQFSAAESSRLATREGAVQARSALLPQLSGEASITRSRTDSSGREVFGSQLFPNNSDSERTIRDAGLSLRQAVFDRSVLTRIRSQKALSEAADFQLESAGNSLITRTSQAYFNVLVAIETLAAAQAQETALKKQFDFADKRLEVGLAPITDVHEARAQYDSARANTIVVQNALEDAYQALVELTGQPVRGLKALPEDFKPGLPAERGAEEWVQVALDNNPALRAKQHQVRSAAASVETARSGHWPTLYLGASYGDRSTDGNQTNNLTSTSTDFESESKSRSIGLTLSVPIFSGGLVSSQVRQAIAQRDVASDELEQQRRALVRNTRDAYQALVAGISEVEARKAAVFSARSAYSASQVGLEVGTRTVLDVLNNQNTLFNAEREYALARYNFLQNRLLLEQAAGTIDVSSVQDVNRLLTVDATAQLDRTNSPR
jgi:outer membrane protein